MINLNDKNIMTAAEAAQIWGKNESYVRTSIRQSPHKWPEGSHRLLGKTLVVTTEGMEKVTGKTDPRRER